MISAGIFQAGFFGVDLAFFSRAAPWLGYASRHKKKLNWTGFDSPPMKLQYHKFSLRREATHKNSACYMGQISTSIMSQPW